MISSTILFTNSDHEQYIEQKFKFWQYIKLLESVQNLPQLFQYIYFEKSH